MQACSPLLVPVFLAAALACYTVHCGPLQQEQDIPPRCREASVTTVSCAQHPPDNLLPHPDDCELFYYCVSPDARPICRQCPARLHFNPSLHVCDRPEAAGCHVRDVTDVPAFATTDLPAAFETTTWWWWG